jgi:hypothetical protein
VNPYAFALLRLITEGKCCDKMPKDDFDEPPADPAPFETPPPDREEFATFGKWIGERVYQEIRYVRGQWKSVGGYLR